MARVEYFGYLGPSRGHGFGNRHRSLEEEFSKLLIYPKIDDGFRPNQQNHGPQGAAALHIVSGWTILAWCDYTGDSRPGSNSNILAQGFFNFEQMLELAKEHFPDVMKRQTVPLTLVEPYNGPVRLPTSPTTALYLVAGCVECDFGFSPDTTQHEGHRQIDQYRKLLYASVEEHIRETDHDVVLHRAIQTTV